MEPRIGYGLDLGIKSGALVRVTTSSVPGQKLQTSTISEWETGPKMSDGLSNTLWFCSEAILKPFYKDIDTLPVNMTPNNGLLIGIDWDLSEAFWGNRLAAGLKAFVSGYLYRAFIDAGFRPLVVSPAAVRQILYLRSNAKKEVVWKAFDLLHPGILLEGSEHVYDATILGWAVHQAASNQSQHNTGRVSRKR